ncbi:hypothetical protein C2S52_014281 [Perilla frutescens var. hirtella]|nr:hypothetical protein C2S52_014281 [Perilla frutescens var. hirtella]
MAENQEQMKPKEREIPVFTVLKNDCILKNIFVLDNPPPISSAENAEQESEAEDVLLVGRHPDCNIKLEHPSISRFHLRIHSKPSSRSLFVTDLSSVHGTCISGKRIEPEVRIKLVQGDTLKLGESSRLYRLDWVPMSFAYKINDPFAPQLDSLDTVNEEREGDENSLSRENEWGQCLSDNVEGLGWQFSEEGLGLSVQETTSKEASMPEDLHHSYTEKDEIGNNHSPEICNKENEISSSHLCLLDASIAVDEETEAVADQDGDSLLHGNDEGWDISEIMEDIERPEKDEAENYCSAEMCNKENELSTSELCPLDASFTVDEETERVADQDEHSLLHENDEGRGLSEIMEDLERTLCDEDLALSMQKLSVTTSPQPEDEVENIRSPEICRNENEFSSIQLCQIEKENRTPQVLIPSAVLQEVSQAETMESCEMNSEKRLVLNIWSRRGKPESVKIKTSRSKASCERIDMSLQVKSLLSENGIIESMLEDQCPSPDTDEENFTPDKENASPNSCLVRSLGNKFDEALKSGSIPNTPISTVDEDEEVFTPDKENMTPNGNLLRSIKNIGSSQEVRHSNLRKPSPLKIASRSIYQEEVIFPPLDCQQHKVLQELKSTCSASKSHGSLRKRPNVLKAEKREPFLPLPVISTSDDKAASTVHECTKRGSRSINYSESDGVNQSHRSTSKATAVKRWTIVVDTACLLNKKSRRELQLLRGLRGTSLVIPRIALRELDCMVRRASFLSRMTEASAALQWIEECMASTKWWIHVQSSAEEGRLVPPTPPAASARWFSEDKGAFSVGSIPFSPYTLQEIVTPTAADHILESALFFKQTMNGQLVLLSDDVTLKIKAMAEGVICETAKEFRASLINPFSARFLYSDSSPRGPTWTCVDDTVLKEKYYPSPSKKATKSGEGAKGLKLILLHNSNFRQMRA